MYNTINEMKINAGYNAINKVQNKLMSNIKNTNDLKLCDNDKALFSNLLVFDDFFKYNENKLKIVLSEQNTQQNLLDCWKNVLDCLKEQYEYSFNSKGIQFIDNKIKELNSKNVNEIDSTYIISKMDDIRLLLGVVIIMRTKANLKTDPTGIYKRPKEKTDDKDLLNLLIYKTIFMFNPREDQAERIEEGDILYALGNMVRQTDENLALECYLVGSNYKHRKSIIEYASLFENDDAEKAKEEYKKAAAKKPKFNDEKDEHGNIKYDPERADIAEANYRIGLLYYNGKLGRKHGKKDYKKAREYFEEAIKIDKGETNSEVRFLLSEMYAKGLGGSKDENKARDLYEKATIIKQKNSPSNNELSSKNNETNEDSYSHIEEEQEDIETESEIENTSNQSTKSKKFKTPKTINQSLLIPNNDNSHSDDDEEEKDETIIHFNPNNFNSSSSSDDVSFIHQQPTANNQQIKQVDYPKLIQDLINNGDYYNAVKCYNILCDKYKEYKSSRGLTNIFTGEVFYSINEDLFSSANRFDVIEKIKIFNEFSNNIKENNFYNSSFNIYFDRNLFELLKNMNTYDNSYFDNKVISKYLKNFLEVNKFNSITKIEDFQLLIGVCNKFGVDYNEIFKDKHIAENCLGNININFSQHNNNNDKDIIVKTLQNISSNFKKLSVNKIVEMDDDINYIFYHPLAKINNPINIEDINLENVNEKLLLTTGDDIVSYKINNNKAVCIDKVLDSIYSYIDNYNTTNPNNRDLKQRTQFWLYHFTNWLRDHNNELSYENKKLFCNFFQNILSNKNFKHFETFKSANNTNITNLKNVFHSYFRTAGLNNFLNNAEISEFLEKAKNNQASITIDDITKAAKIEITNSIEDEDKRKIFIDYLFSKMKDINYDINKIIEEFGKDSYYASCVLDYSDPTAVDKNLANRFFDNLPKNQYTRRKILNKLPCSIIEGCRNYFSAEDILSLLEEQSIDSINPDLIIYAINLKDDKSKTTKKIKTLIQNNILEILKNPDESQINFMKELLNRQELEHPELLLLEPSKFYCLPNIEQNKISSFINTNSENHFIFIESLYNTDYFNNYYDCLDPSQKSYIYSNLLVSPSSVKIPENAKLNDENQENYKVYRPILDNIEFKEKTKGDLTLGKLVYNDGFGGSYSKNKNGNIKITFKENDVNHNYLVYSIFNEEIYNKTLKNGIEIKFKGGTTQKQKEKFELNLLSLKKELNVATIVEENKSIITNYNDIIKNKEQHKVLSLVDSTRTALENININLQNIDKHNLELINFLIEKKTGNKNQNLTMDNFKNFIIELVENTMKEIKKTSDLDNIEDKINSLNNINTIVDSIATREDDFFIFQQPKYKFFDDYAEYLNNNNNVSIGDFILDELESKDFKNYYFKNDKTYLIVDEEYKKYELNEEYNKNFDLSSLYNKKIVPMYNDQYLINKGIKEEIEEEEEELDSDEIEQTKKKKKQTIKKLSIKERFNKLQKDKLKLLKLINEFSSQNERLSFNIKEKINLIYEEEGEIDNYNDPYKRIYEYCNPEEEEEEDVEEELKNKIRIFENRVDKLTDILKQFKSINNSLKEVVINKISQNVKSIVSAIDKGEEVTEINNKYLKDLNSLVGASDDVTSRKKSTFRLNSSQS